MITGKKKYYFKSVECNSFLSSRETSIFASINNFTFIYEVRTISNFKENDIQGICKIFKSTYKKLCWQRCFGDHHDTN